MPNLLIIVPAFNEAENLHRLLPLLKHEAHELDADILGVNDASTDETLQVFKQYEIHTLSHLTQMGYGTTIQTGYKYALKKGYDYVIQLDGDAQHDPRFIPIFLNELIQGHADVVVGSRFLTFDTLPFEPNGTLYYGTFVRRIGIRLFRYALMVLCFKWISDPTSGYIGMRGKVLNFVCGDCFPFDYPDADMILTFVRNGFEIKEIPVFMYQPREQSKLHRGCKPIWYVIKVSISLFVSFLRRKEV